MEIDVGSDVVVTGKVISTDLEGRRQIKLRSGKKIVVEEGDIVSYHPYKPIPEKDERKGN